MKIFKQGEGDTRITGEVKLLGKDLVLHLYGGTRPHVGAVAIALPRPSLEDATKKGATVSIYTFLGHKDDILAKDAACRLAKSLDKSVVVIAGFHLPNINTEQIEQVLQNSRLLCKKIIKFFQKNDSIR